jgi:hypothetical protein
MAAGGRLAEMTGFIEGDQEFQLFDVHLRSGGKSWRRDSNVCALVGTCLSNDWSTLWCLDIPTLGACTMSIFSFIKEAGEKIVIDLLTPGKANASEELKKHVPKSAWATRTSPPPWRATK